MVAFCAVGSRDQEALKKHSSHREECVLMSRVLYSIRHQSGKKILYLPLLFVNELANRVQDMMVRPGCEEANIITEYITEICQLAM